MANIKDQQISVGGAIIFRDSRGRRQFLLVQQKEGDNWEIPKVTVRRGESSVRAVIRMTTEQAGMNARVLEEAGRSNATTVVNGRSIPQKFYYYIMIQRSGGSEAIGFYKFKWMEYADATKNDSLKKEKDMLKATKDYLKEWDKTHDKKEEVLY